MKPNLPSALLELRDVKKHFGGVKAVDGVDLVVAPESIVAVIGPNGAGKTTLFALIMGQLPCTQGEILFEGKRLRGLHPHQRTALGIGRSFQLTSVFPALTAYQNVQVPLLGRDWGLGKYFKPAIRRHRDEVIHLLSEVGLSEYANRRADTLSHGDKKRLELALVLALEPKVLLLDEPTAGMAAEERAAVMELVTGVVRRRRLAMLFTEHDMDTVFAHAEYLVVIDRGRKVAEGPPADIRGNQLVKDAYLGHRQSFGLLA